MATSDILATIGVSILLVGFFLQSTNKIKTEGATYNYLNLIGAAVAGYASWLIPFFPFVILEAVWCIVAIFNLYKYYKIIKTSRETML